MSVELPVTEPFDPYKCGAMTWDGPATRYGHPTFDAPLMLGGKIEPMARGFFVSEAGDVTITMLDGGDHTFANCIAGAWYPFAFSRVVSATIPASSITWLGG